MVLFDWELNDFPRETAQVELFHEWVWIALLHIPNTWRFPEAFQNHLCSDHRGDSSGVADGLTGHFLVAGFVVADVVDEDALLLSVLITDNVTTDTSLALCTRTEAGWIR